MNGYSSFNNKLFSIRKLLADRFKHHFQFNEETPVLNFDSDWIVFSVWVLQAPNRLKNGRLRQTFWLLSCTKIVTVKVGHYDESYREADCTST